MKHYRLFLFMITVVLGCYSLESDLIPDEYQHLDNLTVFSPEKEAPSQIELVREQAFGDTDEALIGRMGDVAVD